tara:strand:- start:38343 stop:39989 length:1647 start_codon:yes stop_codon:yes gene_type:complete
MAGEIVRYVDPDAVGTGTGVDWANAYVSLAAMITQELIDRADLVTLTDNLVVNCRASADSLDTSVADFSGFTQSALYNIQVIGNLATYLPGEAGVYEITTTADYLSGGLIILGSEFTDISGIIISDSNATAAAGYYNVLISYLVNSCSVHDCIIYKLSGSTLADGSRGSAAAITATVESFEFKNNIVFGHFQDVIYGDFLTPVADATYDVYNNTIVAAAIRLIYLQLGSGTGTINCKNNILDDDGVAAGDWGTPLQTAKLTDMDITFFTTTNADYNLLSDASGLGANDVDSTTLTFVDQVNRDYHLAAADTLAIDAGVGPTTDAKVPTLDVDGDTRSGTITDIGADLFAAAAVAAVLSSPTETHTDVSITASVSTDSIAGTLYAVILPTGAAAPTAAQVIAGTDSADAPVTESASVLVTASPQALLAIAGLTALAGYDVYMAQDNGNGVSNLVSIINVITNAQPTAQATFSLVDNQAVPQPVASTAFSFSIYDARGGNFIESGTFTTDVGGVGIAAGLVSTPTGAAYILCWETATPTNVCPFDITVTL